MLMILLAPDTYLWLMAALLAVVTLLAWLLLRRKRKRWLRLLVLAFLLSIWYIFLYGTFVGVDQLEVRHEEFCSKDLPANFDGYRIVHFSDAHLGSFSGWRQPMLSRIVDSINAQHADLIVFTGDLQNKYPEEVEDNQKLLSKLKAKDGICSVLGNHDYSNYSDRDDFDKTRDIGRTISAELDMGWFLLTNGYHRIRRDSTNIVIAGMENDGEGRFPQLGNISWALRGLSRQSFVIMLEHDPTSWHRKILPHSHCQLTLSGHTHGGQFSLFGLSAALFRYREYGGMYYAGERAMNVSTGVGGVVPFRFGVSPEIVVITLKKK